MPQRPGTAAERLADAELAIIVARAQSGHLPSLDRVLRHMQDPLHRHIRLIVRDDATAEDVLQETLWLIARKLPGLRNPRWYRPWAYRIATREAVRRSRSERVWRDMQGDEQLDTVAVISAEPAFREELIAALPTHLAALSPASAVVARLHYIEQLTHAEIAEALEIPVGTVKSRLAYGIAALREALGVVRR
jgi:RNA polymerase sigma-70 factor (ECF subfamily)